VGFRTKKRPAKSCWDTALDLLTRRAHTQAELVRKLRDRRFDDAEIDETIEKARSLHLMEDDEAIALRHAKEIAGRPDTTPAWAEKKLEQRGLDRHVVRAAVKEAFAGWDEHAAALCYVGRETDPRKAARKLERRGFSTDTAMWVSRRLSKSDSNWDGD
jgi:SOS response regulatory protein OraA/RecX